MSSKVILTKIKLKTFEHWIENCLKSDIFKLKFNESRIKSIWIKND